MPSTISDRGRVTGKRCNARRGLENVDIIADVMCVACPALTLAITRWSSPSDRCQLTRQRRIPAAQLAHASQP
jgi:hypothetical protein